MTCSRRHSIQCVMTADCDSQPVSTAAAAAVNSASSPVPQPAVRQPYHRRLSMVGVMPRTGRCASSSGGDGVKPTAASRRRKTATAARLHGSSIAALAAVTRTPLLIGAVNHRKKSLPDNMPFDNVRALPPDQQRKVSVKPNTHRRRRRDATVEFSRVGVGGVYWALELHTRRVRLLMSL